MKSLVLGWVFAGGLAIFLLAASGGGPATSPASSPFAMSKGEVARVLSGYQDFSKRVDRSTFDIHARAAAIGPDPMAAFAFVRDQVANEIYPGVLRGPAGTLQALAGNDLDKSVLLASLLREGKQQVRFAHCELEPAVARRRIDAMFGGPAPARAVEPDFGPALRASFVRSGLSEARSLEFLSARSRARTAFESAIAATGRSDLAVVRESLARAGIKPAVVPDPRILEDARAHYWIQLNRSDRWQDLDASVLRGTGAAPCAPADTFADPPEELFQSITITVRNEIISGSALRVETPLRHQFKVSDLYGKTIRFANVGSMEEGSLLESSRIERFTPYFSTDEDVVSGPEFTAITASSAAGSIADAFGGGDDPPVLAAQWLDFQFDAPGRRSTASRPVVDFVDPAERASGAINSRPDPSVVVVALAQGCVIGVSAGPISQAAALETAFRNLDAQAAGRFFDDTPSPPTTEESPVNDAGMVEVELQAATALAYVSESERALLALAAAAGPHVRLIRDQPLVTIVGAMVRRTTSGNVVADLSVDLRHDRVRVIAESPAFAEDGFWANALRGLVDGAVEHHTSELSVQPSATPASAGAQFDTSLAFQLARAQGMSIEAAVGASARSLVLERFGDAAGRRMIPEIANETAVVLPAAPLEVGDEQRSAFWAVNLRTGNLVPVIDTSLHGQATAEQKLTRLVNFLKNQVKRCVQLRKSPVRCEQMFRLWQQAADDLRTVMNLPRMFGTEMEANAFRTFSYRSFFSF